MWHNVIERFFAVLIGAGVGGLIIGLTGRKAPAWILLMVLMLALAITAPQILFGCFPELGEGWHGFAISIGIAVLISLPFSFLAQRFSRKHNNDA